MELPGSSYLYTLALLAITYGGFAALFMLFREKLHGELVHYDAFLIRGVVQKGFIVAACSMMPPLLAYCDLSHPTIWRLSSLAAGGLQALFLVTWISRRRVVKGVPTSKWLALNLFLQLLTAAYLIVGATGKAFEPGPGPFLIGVTLILVLSCIAYQEALVFLLQGDRSKERRR
jgi:hypothetical protein